MLIKMVSASNRIDFEEKINNTIRELEKNNCTIIDIKYSCVVGNRFKEHSAMIIYEDRPSENFI